MAQGYTYYDGLTRWFIRDEIGLGLRERYQVPKDLRPNCSRWLGNQPQSKDRRPARGRLSAN